MKKLRFINNETKLKCKKGLLRRIQTHVNTKLETFILTEILFTLYVNIITQYIM